MVALPASIPVNTPTSFTVTAEDAFGNTAKTFADTVHFASSDAAAILPGNTSFLGSKGVHTFKATFKTPGSQTLTVSDVTHATAVLAHTAKTAVTYAPVLTSLTLFPSTSVVNPNTTGVTEKYVVEATDQYGKVFTTYTGTVHFTSSDPQAALPADAPFPSTWAGKHTYSVTFKTVGTQWLHVADIAKSALRRRSATSPSR